MAVTRLWLCACMLLGSLLAFMPGLAPAAATAYSVAVVPALPATEIKRRWQPLLDQLSHDTGFVLHFRFYADNEQFEKGLMRSEPDFAMIGPYQMWKMRAHYQPILHDAAAMIGLVMVRKDSPLQSLADLDGHSLAYPNGSDMASTLLFAQTLKALKVQPRLKPQRTHANGLRGVILGKFDAAIINNYSLKLMPPELEHQLRVIHRTDPMPGPAFACAQRIPGEDARKLKEAMLQLKATHPELLESALMPNLSDADLEKDYSIFSSLHGGELTHEAP